MYFVTYIFPSLDIKFLRFNYMDHMESGSFILTAIEYMPLFKNTVIYLSSLIGVDT